MRGKAWIGTQRADNEANEFAMHLLMPEKFVRQEVKRIGLTDLCDDVKVAKLAKIFQVPTTLMAIRLGKIAKLL